MKPKDIDRKAARSPTDSSIGNRQTRPDHGLQRRNDRAKRFRQPEMPLPEQFRHRLMVPMESAAAPTLTSSVRAAVKSP